MKIAESVVGLYFRMLGTNSMYWDQYKIDYFYNRVLDRDDSLTGYDDMIGALKEE